MLTSTSVLFDWFDGLKLAHWPVDMSIWHVGKSLNQLKEHERTIVLSTVYPKIISSNGPLRSAHIIYMRVSIKTQ